MVDTIKFSQMTAGGDIANDDKVPGLLSGANVLFNNPWTFLPPGTTAERPTPSSTINYRLRFNTEEQLYEYYDAVLGAWTQLQESAFTVGPFITYTADTSLPGAQNLGLLANGILKQTISAGSATLNIAVNDTDYYGPGMTGYLRAPAGVKDSNGNIVLGFSGVGSAVNYLNIINSTTSLGPTLLSAGSDANINLSFTAKGSGTLIFNNNSVFYGNIQIGTGVLFDDKNANPILNFNPISSAVNSFQISNASTGNSPNFSSIGTDTNIGITLLPKGDAGVGINTQAISAAPLIIYNGTGGQHQTNFLFANTANARNVTFQDATGTVAFLSDIPSGSPSALTATPDTNVTITLGGTPSTALLQATSITLGWTGQLSLTRGGTNANLTAANGAIPYSTASAIALLAPGTSGQLFQSGGAGAPSWTTATFPGSAGSAGTILRSDGTNWVSSTSTFADTYGINTILYASSANTVTGLATANTSVLNTTSGGVPQYTGYSATGGTSNFVSRDSNGNTRANNFGSAATAVTSAGGTTVLTASSTRYQVLQGTLTQTFQLPDATTLFIGYRIEFNNNSTQTLTVNNASSSLICTVPAGGACVLICIATSTAGGAWDTHFYGPANASWGTSGLAVTGTLAAGSSATQFLVNNSGVITAGSWNGSLITGTYGGTGVNNGANTATYAGNLNFASSFTTSGAFAVTQTYTGATNVTFPTSGTLATTSQIPTGAALTKTDDTNVTLTLGGSSSTALVNAASITAGWTGQLSLARGGTAANLTASNGGIFYSTASAGAILAGTSTARQMLQSGASTTPAWSTATYPATTTINQILYSSAANTVTGLATANSSVLVTDSGGVPSLSTTLPSGIAATNMVLTTPKVITSINDTNANTLVGITATASAVNYVNITNAATANAPIIAAAGSDSNIQLTLNSKGTSGVAIKGVTDASNASAGYVGEFISSRVNAPGNSITSTTAMNVTSISLTAGEWIAYGNISILNAGTLTTGIGWISSTSASIPGSDTYAGLISTSVAGGGALCTIVPTTRYSLSSTTTVYLSAYAVFSSTATVDGFIGAYRIR